jgi:Ornithine cyclodeaminase/mu-crystallin family
MLCGGQVRRSTLTIVVSWSRARRISFAARAQRLVPGLCRPAPDARAAVEGAHIVVLATSSPVPVIDAAWIAPGSYVTTLGPKQQGRAELGLDLPDAASLLVTDSLDQIGAYHPPNVLAGTPHRQRLVSLGAVRAGEVPRPGQIKSRCSSRSAWPEPKPSCSTAWLATSRNSAASRSGCAPSKGRARRVLKDGLMSIVARRLSPAVGRGKTGLWALPLTGGQRWYGRAGGAREDAGMWASGPHTTQSGSARSRMGSHLQLPVELDPAVRQRAGNTVGFQSHGTAEQLRQLTAEQPTAGTAG